MARLPRRVCSSTVLLQAVGVALSLVFFGGAGCARRIYRATSLPPEFLAPVTENIEAIGISHLKNYSVNSQLIDRGDVLEVTIVTDFGNLTTTTTPVRVGEDGLANVPLIGKVGLAGLELEGAEQVIAAAGISRGVFDRPHVTVTMKRQRMNKITVIGAVEEAGVYPLSRGSSSLLAALVSAGGLSEDAGRYVEIRRPISRGALPCPLPSNQPRVAAGLGTEPAAYQEAQPPWPPGSRITRVNLATAAVEGDGGNMLDDGDVVLVTRRAPKPIYVMGLVQKPGEYELPPNQDMYVLDALARAGDRTMQIADKVFVIRQVPGKEQPVVIETSVRQAKVNGAANVRLAPGDIVSVEETSATIVFDAFRNFLRFGATLPLF